jgi:mono/diheme cytochrome c family protein
MTAMAVAVAVMAVSAAPQRHPAPARTLAAELLIMRGDLGRLAEPDVSQANREGLRQRVVGALGLLPWLLRQAGDGTAADRLRAWQGRPFSDAAARNALIAELDSAIARHRIERGAFFAPPPTPPQLREARAIHQTYCAGCHDGAGNGDPSALLPARDLFGMARREDPELFLARLVNGVKGDAAIHFANPLTDAQIGALHRFYRSGAP